LAYTSVLFLILYTFTVLPTLMFTPSFDCSL